MTRSDLQAALQNANVIAFLRVIRAGESNQNDDAYTLINGGGHFVDTSKHPYAGQSAPPGKAAGAYQFIPHTWAALAAEYGFTGFTPAEQDEGAVALIAEHGALDSVKAGYVAEACSLLKTTWVSLPPHSVANAENVFMQWGGTLPAAVTIGPLVQALPDTPPATPVPPSQPTTTGAPMGAVLALLPLLAQFIPQIATMIKPASQSTAKDAAVAQTVINAVGVAAGVLNAGEQATAATVGQAVDKMSADPSLALKVQQAVVTDPLVMGLLEVGGGVQTARAAALESQTADKPFWYSPLFWISVMLMPAIYMIIWMTMIGSTAAPWWAGTGFDPQTKGTLMGTIVGMIIGGVTSVWFGTMYQSHKESSTTTTPTSASTTTTS